MAGARHGADTSLTLTGLLGGSFNPAHRAHRRISLAALDQLGLDDVWWLVSPANPLKSADSMAPFDARLGSALDMARRSRIRPTAIEAQLHTRYTIDTVRALIRRFPNRQFIWIMGADIIGEFHRWRDWRRLARLVPIAVVVRPGYMGVVGASPASAWLRRFVRHLGEPNDWTRWRPPALVLLHVRPDPTSATALRRALPDWYRHFANHPATRAALKRRLP
jgi:nicotinate-nucleotide adenylyltransferase